MSPIPNSPRFAVDTNFVMALVEAPDDARDALALMRERSPAAIVLATNGVLDELEHFASTPSLGKQATALAAAEAIVESGIQSPQLTAEQIALARRLADELRTRRVILWRERNDARILAEGVVLGCQMLISADGDLHRVEREALRGVLAGQGFPPIAILAPRDIVQLLAGRR